MHAAELDVPRPEQKQLQMLLYPQKTLKQLQMLLPQTQVYHGPMKLLYKLYHSTKKLLCKLLVGSSPLSMQLYKLMDYNSKTRMFFIIALSMELQELYPLLL